MSKVREAPAEHMARMRDLHAKGTSWNKIIRAMETEFGVTYARDWLRSNLGKSKCKKYYTQKKTPEVMAKVLDLYSRGIPMVSIAQHLRDGGLDVSNYAVRSWLVGVKRARAQKAVPKIFRDVGIMACSRCGNMVAKKRMKKRNSDLYCRPCLSILESKDGTEEKRIRATIKLQCEQAEQLKQDAFARLSQNTKRALA